MKPDIKHIALYGTSFLVIVVLIAFTGKKNGSKRVNDVSVDIVNYEVNKFTDDMEVLNLLNAEKSDYVLGLTLQELDLKELEARVEEHPFIEDAQVYKDVEGNLSVSVRQCKPIARIFDVSGPDFYIDEKGRILPTTSRYTARVPIVELTRGADWEQNLYDSEYGGQLMALFHFVQSDPFWQAQIAHVVVEKSGELTMLPQVTKQNIHFGQPIDIESKFKKLALFYKDILPNKGWNTYSSVNLKFKNQIVCE